MSRRSAKFNVVCPLDAVSYMLSACWPASTTRPEYQGSPQTILQTGPLASIDSSPIARQHDATRISDSDMEELGVYFECDRQDLPYFARLPSRVVGLGCEGLRASYGDDPRSDCRLANTSRRTFAQ